MDRIFGVVIWSGTYDGLPAIETSYYGPPYHSLYIFNSGQWTEKIKYISALKVSGAVANETTSTASREITDTVGM